MRSVFTPSSLLEVSSSIIELLKENEVSVSNSSRLHQYRRILEKYFRDKLGVSSLDSADAPLLSRAIHEMLPFETILGGLKNMVSEESLQEKLKIILNDAALPIPTACNSSGRDIQFELFAACSFTRIGFPVTLQKPPLTDFRLQMGEDIVAVEVKCPKNINSIAKVCNDADGQMNKANQRGVVVTDLTSIIKNGEHFLTANNHRSALDDLEKRLYRVMRSNLDKVYQKVKNGKLFAWVGYAQAVYLCNEDPIFIAYQWKNFNLERPESIKWQTFSHYFQFLA